MALTCVTGGRECIGCGACRKIDEEKVLYNCIACGEKIYEGDMYYKVSGDTYCENCVMWLEA